MTETSPAPTLQPDAAAAPNALTAPQPGAARPARAQQPTGPAQQVLERLFQLYPKMFGARFLPLKLGVYQELLALHPQEFKKEDLKAALGLHARSTRYLESVAAGHPRHDLNAVPVEDVAPEHVHHAIMEVFRRRQRRGRPDARPWLRERLAHAIEASGLDRQAYCERVRAQDEASLAALEEAFAHLAEQTAKREALLRAYKSSGHGVEEFAQMYGISPALVKRALAQEEAASRAAG